MQGLTSSLPYTTFGKKTQTDLEGIMLLNFHNNYKPPFFQTVLQCNLHERKNEVKFHSNDFSADKGAGVNVSFLLFNYL